MTPRGCRARHAAHVRLSTLLLILAGRAEASATVIFACLLIVAGAPIASRDLWLRKSAQHSTANQLSSSEG